MTDKHKNVTNQPLQNSKDGGLGDIKSRHAKNYLLTFLVPITLKAVFKLFNFRLTIMLIFIALSLALCFMVQTANPLQDLLVSPLTIYTGITLDAIVIAGVIFKKLPLRIGYDIFAGSTLLVWFAYWKPLFNDDSPIFFFYPLYFAFLSAFVGLFFIGRWEKVDSDTLRHIHALDRQSMTQPWVIMLCVLGSLGLLEHFLLYPVTMTLLMLRFVISDCMENR